MIIGSTFISAAYFILQLHKKRDFRWKSRLNFGYNHHAGELLCKRSYANV